MRLYSGKIPAIAQEIVRTLTSSGDLETEAAHEVETDVESVLREYIRLDRDVMEEAKRRLEARGVGLSQLGRVRSQVAKERQAPAPDDVVHYLSDQISNFLFHSNNVEEIYADEVTLRQHIAPVLRRHMDVETQVDQEVRDRIKNLEEGTSAFEIEYSRVLDQIKKKRGLA